MPGSSWKSPEYDEFVELHGLVGSLFDEFPYFRSLPHGNVEKYQTVKGPVLNFSGYDYLGLGSDPRTKEAAAQAVAQYGCSASASRLVAGELDIHNALEDALADWLGRESALAFVSGYGTNVSALGFLFGEDDLIICDQWVHNSVITGAKLARAQRLRFPHNDANALECILQEHQDASRRVVVCIEGLYSMEGDLPPLPEIIELKNRYGFLLFVDEAHSIGTVGRTGRGVTEHYGLPPTAIDIQMGTLSKALGSCGGYIAGSKELISYLNRSSPLGGWSDPAGPFVSWCFVSLSLGICNHVIARNMRCGAH